MRSNSCLALRRRRGGCSNRICLGLFGCHFRSLGVHFHQILICRLESALDARSTFKAFIAHSAATTPLQLRQGRMSLHAIPNHWTNDSILDRGGAFTDEAFTGVTLKRNHISCLEEVEVFAVVVVGLSHRLNTVPPM